MKRLLIFLSSILICIGCNNRSSQHNFHTAYSSAPKHHIAIKQVETDNKIGFVLPLDKNDFIEQPSINVWSNPSFPRDTLYELEFGEKVIIHGEHGDYFHLSPANDTSVKGYLLKGWIVFEDLDEMKKTSFAYQPIDKQLTRDFTKPESRQTKALTLSQLLNKYNKTIEDTMASEEINVSLQTTPDVAIVDSMNVK